MDRTEFLITLALKGMARPEALIETLNASQADIKAMADQLQAEGAVQESRLGLRLTPVGKTAVAAAYEEARQSLDHAAMDALYTEFLPLNKAFKILINQWQMKGDTPNDHEDASYDQAIIADLKTLHDQIMDLLANAAAQVTRLDGYRRRFTAALGQLEAGATRYMTAPIIDSYHTVWFELHEDLIRLTGRTRAGEAASGQAD